MGITIAGTGHRPNKLGGYGDEVYGRLVDLATAALRQHDVGHVIAGGALGWDQALAEAAINLGLDLTLALPFEGFEAKWPAESKQRLTRHIQAAAEVVLVEPPGYAAWKMQSRNRWMVDRCDLLLALWDGSEGGTANCLAYAAQVGKPHRNLWGSWARHSGLHARG